MYETKLKLAKAIRMLENINLLDMNGHLSYRIHGTEQILINSRRASRASIKVSDIVLADLNGNLIEGECEPPSETHIHTSIYLQRSDVYAVLHNHPHWQTVLGISGITSKPVFSIGSFSEDIPTYEKSSLVNTKEMGDEVAEILGQSIAVQLRHHGSVTVGEDIQSVFARSVFMEENAEKQYYAFLLGSYRTLEGENLARTQQSNWSAKIVQKVWDYHEEKAVRDGILSGIEN